MTKQKENKTRRSLSLAVQYNGEGDEEPPSRSRVRALVRAAIPCGDIGVRFVGAAEAAKYNKQYRGKNGATNVLSFNYGDANGGGVDGCMGGGNDGCIVGDIIICAPLAETEAAKAKMPAANHYAHLIVHAALHLCGYTHDNDDDAALMQNKERDILRRFAVTSAPFMR